MKVKIESIKIKNRVRKDLGNIQELAESLDKCGLLNPIVISSDKKLVAGERRLAAARLLGWKTIEAKIIPDASETELLEIELAENIHRKKFTEAEMIEGYRRLEKLRNPNIFIKIIRAIINFFKRLFSKKKREEDNIL